MPREFKRTDRIADQMQRELSVLIQMEVKDPRLGMVTLSGVKVSPDLSYADVYFTCLKPDVPDEAAYRLEARNILRQAAGFLRSELARLIRLRTMPQLRFHYDESLERSRHLSNLISQARQADADFARRNLDDDDAPKKGS